MRLTRKQRAALVADKVPAITYPGKQPCPVKRGDVCTVSKDFKIEVTGVKRNKGGDHVAIYKIHDHRPWLLGKHGYVREAGLALKAGLSYPDDMPEQPEPEAVLDDEQERIAKEARGRFEALRRADIDRHRVRQLSDKLRALHRRAECEGVDLTEQIAAVETALKDAEAELGRAA